MENEEKYSELCDWESSGEENDDVPEENYDNFPTTDISDFETYEEHTCFIDIDADKHRELYGDQEHALILDFYLLLRHKEGCLRLFEDCNPGPLFFANIVVEADDAVFAAVNYAIDFYNHITKFGRLKLERVEYANSALWTGQNYFITFSATNIDIGITSSYQVALQITRDAGYVLGLLRDCFRDMVLAILCLKGKGVDEALTTKREFLKLGLEPEDNNSKAVVASTDAVSKITLDDKRLEWESTELCWDASAFKFLELSLDHEVLEGANDEDTQEACNTGFVAITNQLNQTSLGEDWYKSPDFRKQLGDEWHAVREAKRQLSGYEPRKRPKGVNALMKQGNLVDIRPDLSPTELEDFLKDGRKCTGKSQMRQVVREETMEDGEASKNLEDAGENIMKSPME